MAERGKMVCPDCGVEMNLHAEKVVCASEDACGEGFDEDLGGALVEFHACPECGRTRDRRAG